MHTGEGTACMRSALLNSTTSKCPLMHTSLNGPRCPEFRLKPHASNGTAHTEAGFHPLSSSSSQGLNTKTNNQQLANTPGRSGASYASMKKKGTSPPCCAPRLSTPPATPSVPAVAAAAGLPLPPAAAAASWSAAAAASSSTSPPYTSAQPVAGDAATSGPAGVSSLKRLGHAPAAAAADEVAAAAVASLGVSCCSCLMAAEDLKGSPESSTGWPAGRHGYSGVDMWATQDGSELRCNNSTGGWGHACRDEAAGICI